MPAYICKCIFNMLGMMYTKLWKMIISGNQNWGEKDKRCFLFILNTCVTLLRF